MPYERPNIHDLHAYAPGEQPRRADIVKLNTNENPYPPPQAVLEAVARVTGEELRRYPPPLAEGFRRVAAETHGLRPDQVIATNGGDELLRLALTVFCLADGKKGGIGVAEPSYSLYPVLAAIHDTPVTRVQLDEQWRLPPDFADRMVDAGCRLVLVVNPHAPSGSLASVDQLEAVARRLMGHAVLLIDEAYVDFAQHDALPLLGSERGLDNVLILRTMSKGYSLAGLRFGYGLAHASIIAAMDKARDSYNTDALAQAAATAALRARGEAAHTWSAVIAERARLTKELSDLGMLVYPSQSNFLLAQHDDARALYESLKEKGIFVRYFDQDRLRDKLRITVGSPRQNDALIEALAALVAR